MDMLARREHGRRELVQKLQAKGYEADVAESVAAELERDNLVSDRRFAESLLAVRRERGYGPLRVAVELREKGIDEDLVQDLVDFSDPGWVKRLDGLRRRKYGDDPPQEYGAMARQMRFFHSRGFTREQIERVLHPDRWD